AAEALAVHAAEVAGLQELRAVCAELREGALERAAPERRDRGAGAHAREVVGAGEAGDVHVVVAVERDAEDALVAARRSRAADVGAAEISREQELGSVLAELADGPDRVRRIRLGAGCVGREALEERAGRRREIARLGLPPDDRPAERIDGDRELRAEVAV